MPLSDDIQAEKDHMKQVETNMDKSNQPQNKPGFIEAQVQDFKDAFNIKPKGEVVRVEVVKVSISLWNAISVLSTLAIAAIPAAIIFWMFWSFIVGILGG